MLIVGDQARDLARKRAKGDAGHRSSAVTQPSTHLIPTLRANIDLDCNFDDARKAAEAAFLFDG